MAADEAGRLNTSSPYGVDWIVTQVGNYTIPNLLSYNMHDDIKDELMAIWNDAVNYYFKVDQDYLTRFGYLYSYEGALKAVKEGAPEGFHLPTDAEWMMLECHLGMDAGELEGLENWRGHAGELLKQENKESDLMPCMAELPYMPCQQPIIPVMCIKMKVLTSGAVIRL